MRVKNPVWHTLLFVLGGCSSFNHVNYNYTLQATSNGASIEAPAVTLEREDINCPVFVFPELPAKPPIPLEQIERVKPGDHRSMDKIQQKQIEDLRHYIFVIQKTLRDSHQKYLDDCQARNSK